MSTTDSTCSASGYGDDSSIANETTTTDGAVVPSPSRGGSRTISFRLNDPEANANYGNLSASSRRRLVEQRLAAAQAKPGDKTNANTNHNGPHGQDSSVKLHPSSGGPQLKDDATSLGTLTTSFSIDSDGEDDRKPAAKPVTKLHPADGGPQLEESDASIITSSANASRGAYAYASAAASAASSTLLTSDDDDDIESGKMAKSDVLIASSTKSNMPTARATVVRSIPPNAAFGADHDEEMGPRSDRDLAAIINQENLVEAKLVEEEEATGLQPPKKKKSKRKSKAKSVPIPDPNPNPEDEPKRYCFNHLKRRGCIGLVVLAILVVVAIIVAAVSVSSKSKSSATSAALDGSDETATVEENLPTIEVDPEKEEEEDYVPPVPTPPEEQDSEKMAALKRVIQFYDITPLSTLTDPSTPQYAALDWLANEDSGTSYSSADDVRILQRYVLATLYYSTGGDSWTKSYGFLSDEHECKWFEEEKDWILDMTPVTHGVKCGDEGLLDFEEGDDEHIMEIRLENNNLDGPLPSEINALYLLQGLYLSNNKLRSDLGNDIFDIPNLREIELQRNGIFAKLPTKLPDTLEKLDLTGNRLVGDIPTSIWTLPNLRYLSLGGNNGLAGSISTEVDQSRLQVINLNDVDLSGSTLPKSLAMLDLVIFEVANCGLSGPLPDIFERSDDLAIVNMSKNSLTGSIPISLSRLHTNLSTINLSSNMLSGDIPWGLTKNIALTYLGLSDNQFEGTVPWQFRFFLYLNTLTLHGNKLYGEVDDSLCYINELTADCSGNQPEIACSCCVCDAAN